jgi:gamma-glutamylcyclotransferase (GGCT)/AIG2-like uncharacterized protein YtfP
MNKQLFIYGSLRQGGSRANLLPEHKGIIAKVRLDGFLMYDFGDYPGMMKNKGSHVIGDVIDFSNLSDKQWKKFLQRTDEVEGVDFGLFERKEINTPHGICSTYLFCHKEMLESWRQFDMTPMILTDWEDR